MKLNGNSTGLRQIAMRYLRDNGLSARELVGENAQKLLAHANAQVQGEGFNLVDVGMVRERLISAMAEDADLVRAQTAALREASSTKDTAAGFGGHSVAGSPAFARFPAFMND